ncbi:hypothetical protein AMECASPLE_021296 [Ameca splendens]|uniref:Uncharacterized protein n=1 Tax=Ameca splendens TaxID=208324 RepID=A0ABV0YRU1_9TELE
MKQKMIKKWVCCENYILMSWGIFEIKPKVAMDLVETTPIHQPVKQLITTEAGQEQKTSKPMGFKVFQRSKS